MAYHGILENPPFLNRIPSELNLAIVRFFSRKNKTPESNLDEFSHSKLQKKNMLKCVKTSIHCRLFWPISPTRAAPGRRGAVNGFLQEVGDDLTVTDMALNKEWG